MFNTTQNYEIRRGTLYDKWLLASASKSQKRKKCDVCGVWRELPVPRRSYLTLNCQRSWSGYRGSQLRTIPHFKLYIVDMVLQLQVANGSSSSRRSNSRQHAGPLLCALPIRRATMCHAALKKSTGTSTKGYSTCTVWYVLVV